MLQSDHLKASAMAAELAANSLRPSRSPTPGMIRLQIGDPDFATPEHIRRAMFEAVDAGLTHYASWEGDPELRAAIAGEVSRRAGRPIPESQVVITHGASAAITAIALAMLQPGQRVLIPEPSYSLYADAVRMAGALPVLVAPAPGDRLDLEALAAAAPGARMVIVCNPCNPTGVVHTRAELERVAEIAAARDLLVVSDEAYDAIVFDGTEFVSALQLPQLEGRLVYLQTFSKKYAMTGWRIGYLVAPQALAAGALSIHRMFTGAVNTFVQRGALAALTKPTDAPELMRREYQLRRELVMELLHGAQGVTLAPPEGTFYAFLRSTAGLRADHLQRDAYNLGVAVRSGLEFGPSGADAIRISFATDRDSLTEGVSRLREIFAPA